jgi:hypothetical protein
VRTINGSLPLHLALTRVSEDGDSPLLETVQYLFELLPELLMVANSYGALPVHLALAAIHAGKC